MDSGTQPDVRDALITFSIIGAIASNTFLAIHVGIGSGEHPFDGDFATMHLNSVSSISVKSVRDELVMDTVKLHC